MNIIMAFLLSFFLSCEAESVDNGFQISNIVLEKSSFADVFQVYGKSSLFKSGDASSSMTIVCYLVNKNTVLQFGSSELGQGNLITYISLKNKIEGESKADSSCAKSSIPLEEVTFSNGVHLGISKDKFEKVIGNNSKMIKSDNKTSYIFERKIHDSLDELLTIEVKYSDSEMVQAIGVYKATTN